MTTTESKPPPSSAPGVPNTAPGAKEGGAQPREQTVAPSEKQRTPAPTQNKNRCPHERPLARLRRENRALNEQVKLLCRTEQRLHRSQNALDHQLRSLTRLSEWAVRIADDATTADILGSAAKLALDLFDASTCVCLLPPTPRGRGALMSMEQRATLNRVVPVHHLVMDIVDLCSDTVVLLQHPELPIAEDDTALVAPAGTQTRAIGMDDLALLQLLGISDDNQDRREGGLSAVSVQAVVGIPVTVRQDEAPAYLLLAAPRTPRKQVLKHPLTVRFLPLLLLLRRHVDHALHSAEQAERNAGLMANVENQRATLATTNTQLEESLAELEAAQGRLVQTSKMEGIGLLAGGVAHDFNNLLTVIMGHCACLQMGLTDPEQVQDVQQVIEAAQRAAKLTTQLLAFSRKQERRLEVIDLLEMVSDMGGMLRRLMPEDIRVELPPSRQKIEEAGDTYRPIRVRADRGQMEQVLMNLVINARDATPSGGTITVTLSANGKPLPANDDGPGTIGETGETGALGKQDADSNDAQTSNKAILQHSTGPSICLSVADTGCGIDQDTQARLFEPFFTTKPVGEGTGMGLAMVYGIVKQSGGHIEVTSRPGNGARFDVLLPNSDPPPQATEEEAEEAPQVRGSERILLVEDEDGIRTLVQRLLQAQGYQVLQARNGAEAIQVAQEEGRNSAATSGGPANPNQAAEGIDLLITDVVMPEMGGVDLARSFMGHFPNARVLFMSGYASAMLKSHGLESRPRHYLQKPFLPDKLIAEVRAVLDDPDDGPEL